MARLGIMTYDFHPSIGGGGRHVTEVCARLDPDSFVVYSGRRGDGWPQHHAVCAGMKHGFMKQWLMSLWLNARIKSVVRQHGLECVNVHSGPGGLFLWRRPGAARLVVTAHHTYAQQAEHMPGQGWKRVFVPLERRTLRLADVVVCVSRDTQTAVVERYGVPRERTCVIPNGVDVERFTPDPGVARDRESVLFVSRLDRRKGVDFLLRAFARVVARDANVRLRVAGTGAMRPELERFVAEHGLAANVEFLGFVADGELPGLYRRAGCFVMPSVFEGFGIPVIEAMACGAVAIGTDVDGVRSLIDDGRTGLLVPYGDEEALAAAILRVCHGEFEAPPDLAARVRADYDWARAAAAYEDVFGAPAVSGRAAVS